MLARRVALPLVVIAATTAWLGYYDWKAFGKVTTLPYTLNRAQYAMAPYFVWQHFRPAPQYRYAAIRDYYDLDEMPFALKNQSRGGFWVCLIWKAIWSFQFYAGFIFLIPMLMLRRVLGDRRIRFLVLVLCVIAAGETIEIFFVPHYVAPFLVAFYAIGLQAMRHQRLWRPEGRPVGLGLVRFMIAFCIALAGLRLFARPLHVDVPESPTGNWSFNWFGPEHFGIERAKVEAHLASLPGEQLAIVRYGPRHYPVNEWVYNEADIDSSKVIWARDADPEDNQKLMHYYKDRTVWLVEPDAVPARVTRYSGTEFTSAGGR
jgi:hypothetical protein